MNSSLFRATQACFRRRLLNLRTCQLARAADRAYHARIAWEQYLVCRRRERAAILAAACPGCGFAICLCYVPVTREFIVGRLREFAGLNPHANGAGKGDRAWRDWNAGPAGFQTCGPSSWDNAVRCVEDRPA